METGYEYQWELEEISEVEGVEYFNFCMTCNVEEVDESDVIIDTYSEYIINVLVSVDDGEILEARENTNTHKWEIEY